MAKTSKTQDEPKTLDEFKAFVEANGADKLSEAQATEYARLLQAAIDAPPALSPPSAPEPVTVTFRAIDGKMVWLHPGIGCPGEPHFVTFAGSFYTTSDPGEIAALRAYATRPEFANVGVLEDK